MELLKGRRPDWGIQRHWIGNYMMEFNENLQKEVYKAALAKVSIDPKTVLFSSFCQKFNRHGKVSQAWPLLDLLCKVNSLTFSIKAKAQY